ncbi:MAG: DUF3822 family protein [Flavobacteriaceae bacterium]|nr:DUF3822 family protein [Flavobacteriaceae bacterium]
MKLSLLFTQNGIQWQESEADTIINEEIFFLTEEEENPWSIEEKLDEILKKNTWKEIRVFSALNHFTLTPEGFSQHDLGQKIISYNAEIDPENEELMLSINCKFSVQFYYLFPKHFYHRIKELKVPTAFNFTGEKLLNSITPHKQKEIHINLFHNQVEFLALNEKKLVLYNNLDATSEVDFLYFIMFSLSKINFKVEETHFYIYGEASENETFISELQKFAPNMSIMFQNYMGKNFILNH